MLINGIEPIQTSTNAVAVVMTNIRPLNCQVHIINVHALVPDIYTCICIFFFGYNTSFIYFRNDNDKKVLVRFHILTSEDYQFDPVKFDCIVVIGAEELGGWNRKSRVMRVYR